MVLDALGCVVVALADGPLGAGVTRLSVDAGVLAPGIYVVRSLVGPEVSAVRFVVTR